MRAARSIAAVDAVAAAREKRALDVKRPVHAAAAVVRIVDEDCCGLGVVDEQRVVDHPDTGRAAVCVNALVVLDATRRC